MATGAAAAIAAAAARARREVHAHFEDAGAFNPGQAIAYEGPDHIHQTQFDMLVDSGVLRPTGDGRYWLDLQAERVEEQRRRSAAILILKIAAIAAALVIAAVAIFSARH